MSLLSIPQNSAKFDMPQNLKYADQAFNKSNSTQEKGIFKGINKAGSKKGVSVSEAYYSTDMLSLHYSNNDGDSAILTVENIELQKAMISMNGNTDSEEWKEIIDKIKEEYLNQYEYLIKKLIENLNGKDVDIIKKAESNEIEGLPEYWNAENTSQRIVDFATSFYGIAESSGKDYYLMMKCAIEEGFSQAMSILGELPGPVNDLAHNTFELAMQKLDAWAIEQGVDIGETENEVVA